MSHLLLWRHAEAQADHPRGDLARALTERGHAQAAGGADWIKELVRRHRWTLEVVASPAVRTRETAETLGMDFATDDSISTAGDARAYLGLARKPRGKHDALLLVGHQPTIGETVALLMTGVAHAISVRKGSVWWFSLRSEEPGDGAASLRGVWSPD